MAGIIPATELAALRAAAETSLDTPVTVTRPPSGVATNGYGYPAAGTATTVATCNARFRQPDAPLLAQYAERIGHLQAWLVALPVSVLPQEGDSVTITASGASYTVHVILQPQSYSTLNRVLAAQAN